MPADERDLDGRPARVRLSGATHVRDARPEAALEPFQESRLKNKEHLLLLNVIFINTIG